MQHRNFNALPVVSVLNLILTSLPRKMAVIVGRSRYFSRLVAEPFRLGGGVEAWKGIYASVRPTYKQLMVNVDVCVTSFRTAGNLAQVMNAVQDASWGARSLLFRGVRIEANHLGYRKSIQKRVPLTARTYLFDSLEYGTVTVEDYLRRSELACHSVSSYFLIDSCFSPEYNIQLQYPDLQLVEFGGPNGSYLPAELCDILPGQPYVGALAAQQATIMSVVARQPAKICGETTINQLRHQLGLNVIRPELESFGITISPDMAVVPGRILSKPGITYASSASASISDRASWNLVGVKFAIGARLDNWAILAIKDGDASGEFSGSSDRDLLEVVSAFRHMCNASGMLVTTNPTYTTAQLPPKDLSRDPMRREAIHIIKDALLTIRPKPTLILIMLANGDSAIYEGIKHLCDVRLDVATVCVQSVKIRKCNPHYLANVALKVNMKLGGINHKLDGSGGEWLKSASTMVVGMDVTHPGPGSSVGCRKHIMMFPPSIISHVPFFTVLTSIAAVVASVDSDFAQYPVAMDMQSSRSEVLQLSH